MFSSTGKRTYSWTAETTRTPIIASDAGAQLDRARDIWISGDPPPDAEISGSHPLTFFTCDFSTAIPPFATLQFFVTATDPTTGLNDQYELVFYTDISDHGSSMAAASSWQSIDENTTSQEFRANVGFPQAPERLLRDRADCTRSLPVNGFAHYNGSPGQNGFCYPGSGRVPIRPEPQFLRSRHRSCPLRLLHLQQWKPNDIVGPLNTNIATAAIQVAPLLRIVGSSVLDEAQSCDGRPERALLRTKMPWSPRTIGGQDNFTAYLNNPREDGIPVEEQLTFSHIGPLLIFDAQGNQIPTATASRCGCTGPISGSTQVPFSVESVVPGGAPSRLPSAA